MTNKKIAVNNQDNQQILQDNQSIRELSFKQREELIKNIYLEVLGKNPTYAEIDKFAYKDITPNQIRLELLRSQEHAQIIQKASFHEQDQQTIKMLKSELKQVVWIVKSLQERINIKIALLKEKQKEIQQLRQFIKRLAADYPDGPSAFFCTIYKTEYTTKIINTQTQSKTKAQ